MNLEEITATELSLDAESTRVLPAIVRPGEPGDGGTLVLLIDRVNSLLLLLLTRNGGTVGLTGVWPSGLEDDDVLGVTAVRLGKSDLVLDELTGIGWGNAGVEEWVNVNTDDVHVLADVRGNLLQDVDWLSGGDWSLVTSSADLLGNGGHVGTELGTTAETVEDGLVTNDKELDETPLGPGDDVSNLRVGSLDTSGLDEDTENDLESVLLASRADRLESTAVRRVETESLESLGGNSSNITIDLGSGLARLIIVVW